MDPSELTLLVVDDVEDNRDLLQRRLSRKGFRVRVASSGHEALVAVDAGGIDMVVLDVMMPEMSGTEVLEILRRKHTPQGLPVIMATARTGPEEMVAALEAGANDYVTKPIDIEVLVARIKAQFRALGTARQRTETAPTGRRALGVGSVIEGRYELGDAIGVGGFGTVYRAKHLALDTPVAVKVMHRHLASSHEMRLRFTREGVSACRVRHPHAIAVFDAGATVEGVPYLVMELLLGRSLAERIQTVRVLDDAEVAAVLIPVCEALQEAHRTGVIHRDISPGNIFLSETPKGMVVKVVDFGLAHFTTPGVEAIAENESLVGTIHYMAPERIQGDESGAAGDVYSVGVVAYRILTGRLPYARQSSLIQQVLHQTGNSAIPIESVRPGLPEELRAVVTALLSLDPALRPTLSSLIEVLQRFAVGGGGGAEDIPVEVDLATTDFVTVQSNTSPEFAQSGARPSLQGEALEASEAKHRRGAG